MNTQIEVLVIGRPSRFRDSIHLLLASMSLIEKIHLADDIASASKMKAALTVVVVDADAGGPCLPAAINQINTAWPEARLVILSRTNWNFRSPRPPEMTWYYEKAFRRLNLSQQWKHC